MAILDVASQRHVEWVVLGVVGLVIHHHCYQIGAVCVMVLLRRVFQRLLWRTGAVVMVILRCLQMALWCALVMHEAAKCRLWSCDCVCGTWWRSCRKVIDAILSVWCFRFVELLVGEMNILRPVGIALWVNWKGHRSGIPTLWWSDSTHRVVAYHASSGPTMTGPLGNLGELGREWISASSPYYRSTCRQARSRSRLKEPAFDWGWESWQANRWHCCCCHCFRRCRFHRRATTPRLSLWFSTLRLSSATKLNYSVGTDEVCMWDWFDVKIPVISRVTYVFDVYFPFVHELH